MAGAGGEAVPSAAARGQLVIRQRGIVVRERLLPSAPAEEAVYLGAELDEHGARIHFPVPLLGVPGPGWFLDLPRAVHAAALESLARALRLALECEEQRALSQEGLAGSSCPSTRDRSGPRAEGRPR
jgi:hypothetical protein